MPTTTSSATAPRRVRCIRPASPRPGHRRRQQQRHQQPVGRGDGQRTQSRLFVVARQNQAANSALFSAYGADFTVLPSRIIAQECIALLTAPLLARFLERVQQLDETACRELVERLLAACSGLTPVVWDNRLNAAEAPASWQA
jgi:hypothetical protein